MRALLQRVQRGEVRVGDEVVGAGRDSPRAGPPELAEQLWRRFADALEGFGVQVVSGLFLIIVVLVQRYLSREQRL